MAIGTADDNAIKFVNAKIDTAIGNYEQYHPTKAQFTRAGRTSRWFNPASMPIKGMKRTYRMFVAPMSAVRRDKYPDAVEAEFPVARDFKYLDLSVSHADLSMFKATGKWNKQKELQTEDDVSVARLAIKIFSEINRDFADSVNNAMFEGEDCAMATIDEIYDDDGTTFSTPGGYATKFIKIVGPISRFQPDMVLEIYDGTTTTQKNATVVVQDVIPGEDGPWHSDGSREAGIGPGIKCAPCDADGTTNTTAWSAVDVPIAGDALALSGEYNTATPNGFHGIPDFFDTSVDCHRDNSDSASVIDREASGYAFLNPEVIIPSGASAGTEKDFDMDEHFGQLEDTMPFIIDYGRGQRNIGDGLSGAEDKIEAPPVMLFATTPAIVNYIARINGADSARFTTTAAMSLDAAKKKEMFGVVGFEGTVYHSPSLPPVAFQADPNCKPFRGYLLDPQSFRLLTFGKAPGNGERVNIEWVTHGGAGRIHPCYGSTGGLTFYVQAGAHTSCGLTCDQPRANVGFQHIKSDRQ